MAVPFHIRSSKAKPLHYFFAAAGQSPCTEWPRTDSAAVHARYIQGGHASHNHPDARNRAPASHVSLHISDVSAQRKVRGVKRGQETILGVLSPFALRRGYGVSAGEHRQSPRRGHGVFSAAEGGNSSFMMAGSFHPSHRLSPDRSPS